MQDFNWSRETSAKVIYTSVESEIHMESRLRIKKTVFH